MDRGVFLSQEAVNVFCWIALDPNLEGQIYSLESQKLIGPD
jgi:hypothetical protein